MNRKWRMNSLLIELSKLGISWFFARRRRWYKGKRDCLSPHSVWYQFQPSSLRKLRRKIPDHVCLWKETKPVGPCPSVDGFGMEDQGVSHSVTFWLCFSSDDSSFSFSTYLSISKYNNNLCFFGNHGPFWHIMHEHICIKSVQTRGKKITIDSCKCCHKLIYLSCGGEIVCLRVLTCSGRVTYLMRRVQVVCLAWRASGWKSHKHECLLTHSDR